MNVGKTTIRNNEIRNNPDPQLEKMLDPDPYPDPH